MSTIETLQYMAAGFGSALTPINLLAMLGGTALGIVIGCLPGLSAAMGVALMLPLTFTMPADTGLIVLGAIYCGAIFGGSISAILIHTPGTPASAATAIEGYQMTLRGKAGKALATACWRLLLGRSAQLHFAVLLRSAPCSACAEVHVRREILAGYLRPYDNRRRVQQVYYQGPYVRCAGPAAVHYRP